MFEIQPKSITIPFQDLSSFSGFGLQNTNMASINGSRGKDYFYQYHQAIYGFFLMSVGPQHIYIYRLWIKFYHSDLSTLQMLFNSSRSVLLFTVIWQPFISINMLPSAYWGFYRTLTWPTSRLIPLDWSLLLDPWGCFPQFSLPVKICVFIYSFLCTKILNTLPLSLRGLNYLCPLTQPVFFCHLSCVHSITPLWLKNFTNFFKFFNFVCCDCTTIYLYIPCTGLFDAYLDPKRQPYTNDTTAIFYGLNTHLTKPILVGYLAILFYY